MESVDITPDQDGGIIKLIQKLGDDTLGSPWIGDKVSVHYVGLLEDGTTFDSSRDRNERFSFNLGKGEVINGWDIGVKSMKIGEVAKFTIKSEYAYGATGSPPKIGPDATLIFEIELFEFSGEDVSSEGDGSIMKRCLRKGDGYDTPNNGSSVVINISGKIFGSNDDSTFIQKENLIFVLGEGTECHIPMGLETAIQKMKKNEESSVIVFPNHGYDHDDCDKLSIPVDSKLVFHVTLVSFEKAKDAWQLDGDEKLSSSRLLKQRGDHFIAKGKYSLATAKYSMVVDYLDTEVSLKEEKETERLSLLRSSRLNLAMCHLKESEWIECRRVCDKILEESVSEKAFYRRGIALVGLKDYDLAIVDFNRVLEVDSKNQAAKNKIIFCRCEIIKEKEQDKRTYGKMFEIFAASDKKKEEKALLNHSPVEISDWNNQKKEVNGKENIKVSGDVEMSMDLGEELKDVVDQP